MTEKPGPEPSASTPNNNATTTTNSGAPAQASTGSGPAPNSGNNPQPASTGAGAATGTNPNTNRGLPYYEKLRRELRDTIQRKRVMDKTMAQLEDQIYRFENSYLEETTAGNIVKGFDNYIKGSSNTTGFSAGGLSSLVGGAGGPGTRRKAAVLDTERVFSRSSASYLRDSPTPSTQTTPSHAATPSSMYNGNSGRNGENSAPSGPSGPGSQPGSVKGGNSSKNKKKAASGNSSAAGRNGNGNGDEDAGDDEKQPVKRLKITYSRE